MAIRKIPTFFAEERSLRVSVYDDGSFYISPGLIFVGGKSFFFKGESGRIEQIPCRIGIKVEGNFAEPYSRNWPKHGEEVLVQAFYNIYPSQRLEDLATETLPDANPGIGLEPQTEGLQIGNLELGVLEPGSLEPGSLDEDPSTTEEDNEENSEGESAECKAERANIKKARYPSSYTEYRFVSNVSSIKAISLSLGEHSSNFKCLATLIKGEKLYQHLYGSISFYPLDIATRSQDFAAAFSIFGDCYSSQLISKKDIVLI